jgi:diaminopimelate decarboxylase
MVRARIDLFRAHFSGISLHYAIKANTYQPLLNEVSRLVDGLDIASAGEMDKALAAGTDPSEISFAGPGKTDRELEAAIDAGITLNLESEGEGERALAIARRRGRTARLAVRVNPDFEIRGSGMRMGGGAKPFGVDAERVPALVRHIVESGGDWRGFHIFAGSQALGADALIEAQGATVALAAELAGAVGRTPPLVNLGGGFGIPYFAGERALDVAAVGAALAKALKDRPKILAESGFAIELGRWLVGEAGVYLTRIVDRKTSHGKTFLVVDGGMHHQLAASGNFGQVVRRNYPVAIATRFGGPDTAEADLEEASIVGCLCTPLDRLGDDVMLPRAEIGDLVAVFLAGAYGLSASPQAFLGHGPALEMLAGTGG